VSSEPARQAQTTGLAAAASLAGRRSRRAPMYGPVFLILLVLPFILLLGIGFIFPMAQALWHSVFGVDTYTGEVHTGQAYHFVATDPVFLSVLIRTMETAATVAGICLVVAYPTAEFIHRASPRIRPLLLGLVLVPLWSSTIARSYSWVGVLMNNGLLDRITGALALGHPQLLYTQTAVVVGMTHVLLPLLLLPVYAAVRNYDERLTLASLSLGAGRLQSLVRVKIPVLLPSILAATTAVFVIAMGFYVTPALLGGPSSQMISNLIAQQALQRFDLIEADAMSIILVVTVLVLLGVLGSALALVRRRAR
jgi:mannopine transport system permease protein